MYRLQRLQKILAAAGIASRRKAEDLIKAGRVSVNGRVVTTLGAKADVARDHIKVDGKLIRAQPRKIYLLFNKPQGVICSISDPEGRTMITDLIKVKERVYPVGRLDYRSEGLILLTNDGDFANIVTRAGKHLPKVYDVKVRSILDETQVNRLRSGLRISEVEKFARCKIRLLREGNNTWYQVTLTQGRNQQIRRMFAAIGHPVMKLRRRRIGFLTDRELPVGQSRFLTPLEVERILKLRNS